MACRPECCACLEGLTQDGLALTHADYDKAMAIIEQRTDLTETQREQMRIYVALIRYAAHPMSVTRSAKRLQAIRALPCVCCGNMNELRFKVN